MIAKATIASLHCSFIRDIIDFAEKKDTKVTLFWKELWEKDEILNQRRIRRICKRVILKDQIIVSREAIIEEVEKIDQIALEKKENKGKGRGKGKKRVIKILSEEEEEEESKDKLA